MDLSKVLARWDALEWDFARILHRTLDDVFLTETWRWFQHKLSGLLMDNTSTLHHLFADDEAES